MMPDVSHHLFQFSRNVDIYLRSLKKEGLLPVSRGKNSSVGICPLQIARLLTFPSLSPLASTQANIIHKITIY
ncbi:hypothetical protein M378DRAFT_160378 [Amanita muscaria Koide BX008]|uniref:Uncharacterized protein n=1 Tax=Amanita muscaria (strain Koide BX008) TaxID=946122 RepID=A0A0C2TIQ5_AMAMK|nr:hypothetical protein M378DRAFT_160378 [Amanita muscaria Koide BX008]